MQPRQLSCLPSCFPGTWTQLCLVWAWLFGTTDPKPGPVPVWDECPFDIRGPKTPPSDHAQCLPFWASHEETCNSDVPAQNTDHLIFSLPPFTFSTPKTYLRLFFFFLVSQAACGSSWARDRTHTTAATKLLQWQCWILNLLRKRTPDQPVSFFCPLLLWVTHGIESSWARNQIRASVLQQRQILLPIVPGQGSNLCPGAAEMRWSRCATVGTPRFTCFLIP